MGPPQFGAVERLRGLKVDAGYQRQVLVRQVAISLVGH